jgi:hypothetical protein
MSNNNPNDVLQVPLYHGTSTLFLESISKHGLGGKNPVEEWKILELAQEVYKISSNHLEGWDCFDNRKFSFGMMTEQVAGGFNWQHGDAYVSPSKRVAIGYAIGKRFGSELLTYTLDWLEELIRREIPGVKDSLFRRFPEAFSCIEASPSPILIELQNIPKSSLVAEDGGDPSANFNSIASISAPDPEIQEILLGVNNFRLKASAPVEDQKYLFINVVDSNPHAPKYKLYSLIVD